jgi:hypothetical protein
MSARNRRAASSAGSPHSELERLVELDPHRPGAPPSAGEPDQSLGAVTGLDDVRAPLANPPAGQSRLSRRTLLAWGGAAALLPAFPGIARAQEELAASGAPQPMSVGFVEGSESWKGFKGLTAATLNRGVRSEPQRAATATSVVPATSLIAGDQALANQVVRVGVHGFYPIPNPLHVKTAYLTVFFPSPEPALRLAPLPFTAWGYKSKPAPDPAASVRFVAPLGADGALDFLLEVNPAPQRMPRRQVVSPAPSAVGGRFTTSFTVDWFGGRPRLQRGVYLLGLAPDTWASDRTLPQTQTGQQRPIELISLIVSFDPIVER